LNIKVTTALDVRDGYGNIGQNLILSLVYLGHNVSVERVPIWYSEYDLDSRVIDLIDKPLSHYDYQLLVMYPDYKFTQHAKEWGIITMYEASRCPTVWAHKLNALGATVFAPSKFVQDMFIDSGVTTRVQLLPLAVNGVYQPLKRDRHDAFRYLSIGKFEPRKNGETLLRAFNLLASKYKDIEILFKTREHFVPKELLLAASKDDRIKIISTTVPEKRLLDLYAYCDCFVYPSRGEGYSFPPRNALATGMPTIVTGWSATNEIEGAIKVPVQDFSPMFACGFSYGEEKNLLMANVSHLELADRMEWVYLNYEEALEGVVLPTRTWDNVAEEFTKYVEGC
jgi:glycosyltransferase involved in cell wall biosynthesis